MNLRHGDIELVEKLLHIDHEGVVCVITFAPRALPALIDDRALYRGLTSVLTTAKECETVRFVLTGHTHMPSSWLGLLALPIRLGLSVSVFNPSAHVREILHSTRLESVLAIESSRA